MFLTKKKMYIVIIFTIVVVIVFYFKFAKHYPREIDLNAPSDYWGITFSTKICKEMGLDWKEVYIAILDDLKVRQIRIPIYWDEIEPRYQEYNFSDYDFIFNEGAKRNVKFVANIGWRLPRWPECHAPVWVSAKGVDYTKERTMTMLEEVVKRYRNRGEIIMWQVENEPLLDTFGKCPNGDEEFLKKEVALVKQLDSRPVLITSSGELGTWKRENKIGDYFGTTMYRVVWNPFFGYFRYFWPAGFYKFKAKLIGMKEYKMNISELQAEPWVPNGTLKNILDKESNKSFNIKQFRANLQYAINADLNKTYLWGAEWWYFRKTQGNSEYWDLAKTLFNK